MKFIRMYKIFDSKKNKKIIKCKHFNRLKYKTHDSIVTLNDNKVIKTQEVKQKVNIKTFTSKTKNIDKIKLNNKYGNILKNNSKNTFIHDKEMVMDKQEFDKLDKRKLKLSKNDISKESMLAELEIQNRLYDINDCEELENLDKITSIEIEDFYNNLKN